jgi:hydrogenase-4 component E
MTGYADLLVLTAILLDLYMVATSRLGACVRASALQGVILGGLPLVLWASEPGAQLAPILAMSVGALVIKGILIPRLLLRAIRQAGVRREVEPFVSLHLSIFSAALLVGVAFWLASALAVPIPVASSLIVPGALATLLIGFFLLMTRKKAVTQVIGYLVMENGVFIFGQVLAGQIPFAVELGILLDIFVGVFVFGIAIYHISDEFDHIDTAALTSLRD